MNGLKRIFKVHSALLSMKLTSNKSALSCLVYFAQGQMIHHIKIFLDYPFK
jgi:hypothetical protein